MDANQAAVATPVNANNFELNKGDQFIIAIDISGSMAATDCPGQVNRLRYTLETLHVFAQEAFKWDPDGVSFYPFNHQVFPMPDVKTLEEIDAKISTLKPGGGTDTASVINAAYQEHKTKKNEQTFLIVFTDGQPEDEAAVEQVIINITNEVKDEKEFRIEILTVGQRTADLNKWLTDLDDNLKREGGAKYDIVNVQRMEDVDFRSAVEHAIEG